MPPAGDGSIPEISDGPSIYAVLPVPLATDIPSPVVVSLLVTFNDVAVIAPTFISSSSLCPLTSNFPTGAALPMHQWHSEQIV